MAGALTGPEGLTEEWMSTAVDGWPAGPVRAERIGAERGISGAVHRVVSEAGPTAIVKLPIPGSSRSMDALTREVGIYLHPDARHGLRSPRLLYATADGGAPVIVLEDVGHLRPGDDVEGCGIDDAGVALSALGRFHRAWRSSSDVDALAADGVAARFEELYVGLRDAMATSIEPGRRVANRVAGTDGVAVVEALEHRLPAVARLGEAPCTLVHRDFRLDNLFFLHGEDDVVAVDWANLCVANGGLDVGGFLGRCLREVPTDETVRRLIDTYAEAAGADAVGVAVDSRLGGWYWLGWALIVSTTMELAPGPKAVVDMWIRRLTPFLAAEL